MGPWGPTAVTAIIALLGWVAIWGTLRQQVADNSKDIANLQNSEQRQWSTIGRVDREVGQIKGHLRINGGSTSQGGDL